MSRPLPVATVLATAEQPAALWESLPVYSSPEDAVLAVAGMADHAAWRRRTATPRQPLSPPPRPDDAARLLARCLDDGPGWLKPEDAADLGRCYGLTIIETRTASSVSDCIRLAAEIGFPVVVKAVSRTLLHKTDAGGVRLRLGREDVEEAAETIVASVGRAGHVLEGFLVQPMAAGAEVLVGITQDPNVGPLVVVAAGGVAAELVGDVAVRIAPVDPREAGEMLRSLKTYPLLDGYRGAPKGDVGALQDLVARVSALAAAHPEILELDANPVVVSGDGVQIVDLRARVASVAPRAPVSSMQADA